MYAEKGEDVLTYKNGKRVYLPPASAPYKVDFGEKIGFREVRRLNLIETESCHASGIKSVSTFFGTSPPIWNKLFALMGSLIPKSVLQNRDLMERLAVFSLPVVYFVDKIVGSKNAIRVDVLTKGGETFTGILSHQDMEEAVGDSIAAFAEQILLDNIPPGVFFPEEVYAIDKKIGDDILAKISKNAITYEVVKNGCMSYFSRS